jgi:hypothetical protein
MTEDDARPPLAGGPRPTRWEYYTCEVDEPLGPEDLDPLGALGWGLCGLVRSRGLICYTFRRPISRGSLRARGDTGAADGIEGLRT